jgi:biotin carboxylase
VVAAGAAAGSKRLLVLGAGPAQLGALEAARGRGLHVIAVDRDPAAPGFRVADRRAIISAEDEPQIDRLAGAERVDGIIAPGIDFPVAIAARVAKRYSLPHPLAPETALVATSKVRQRERFLEAGVPHVRSEVCSTLADARTAAAELGYPCVVKAPDRHGQKGVELVEGPGELSEAVERALAAARGSVVLVQELVDGREVTVNGFSVGGRYHPLTVTDRLLAEPPAFGVALAHAWPSELSSGRIGDVVALSAAAAEAVGVSEGPTYTQVLVGPGGPVVGELAARLGGGHDAELCEAALGVDLNGLALSAALGEEIDDERLRPRPQDGGACIRFLVAAPGALEAVENLDGADRGEGVLWARIYREPGYVLGPLRRGSDRAGAVLAVGGDRAEALERATAAAERIRFVTAGAPALLQQ